MSLEEQLKQGVAALGLTLPPATLERLLNYLGLLAKWNKVYNLTAVREPEMMISHHLLDCLAVLPHIQAKNLLDVGSGAGFPGIPLALAHSDWRLTLLDSSHKKTAFLKQVLIELKLGNATVVTEKVEAWKPEAKFDLVISRAFSDLAEFVRLSGHLCAPNGMLMAMKGIYPYEEVTQLPREYRLERTLKLSVPGLPAERCLVVIGRAN